MLDLSYELTLPAFI